MASTKFSDMEIDAIGEIMNISLGASATAVSNLLGAQTNITTPVVKVQTKKSFQFKDLEPAIGVAISYTEGLSGRNIMLFSRRDVRIIVGMMMQMEIPEDQFEMDEMNKSAICEVMNQMMGSAATALSEFLGYTVNISTPQSFEIGNEKEFKDEYFPGNEQYVVVRFTLEVGDKISSEFMNIMTVDLAKKMIEPFRDSMGIPDGNEENAGESQEGFQKGKENDASAEAAAAASENGQAESGKAGQTAETAASAESTEQIPDAGKESDTPESEPQESAAAEEPAPQIPPVGGVLNQAETDALIARAKGMSAGSRPMTQEEMDAILARTRAEMADVQQSAADEQPAVAGTGIAAASVTAERAPAQAAPAGISAESAGAAPVGTSMTHTGAENRSEQMPQGTASGTAAAGASAMEPMMMQLLNSMQQSQAQMLELIRDMRAGEEKRTASPQPAPGAGKRESTVIRSANSQTFAEDEKDAAEVPENREMLMKVPLELSVEIGRTMKPVREILELTQGSLVVLDKMAGEQADLYVNGECIAKGDIVVVEDNFGIRITEIINKDIYQEKLSS